jgi:Flp pilus assembly pilin Flp
MRIFSHLPRRLVTHLLSRFQLDRGAALLEYVMLVGLIAVVALIAVATFGGQLAEMNQEIADTLVKVGS